MEVKIVIENESKFKDIIEKELEAFSKEELHEIVKSVVVKNITEDKSGDYKKMFIKEEGSWNRVVHPGPLLEACANNLDLSDILKPFFESIVKDLTEKHEDIVKKMLWEIVLKKITDSSTFQSTMEFAVRNILHQIDYEKQQH